MPSRGAATALVALAGLALWAGAGRAAVQNGAATTPRSPATQPLTSSTQPWGPEAQQLVDRALDGFADKPPVDHHVHLLAMADNPDMSYALPWVNPRMLELEAFSPRRFIRGRFFAAAAGIEHPLDPGRANAEFRARLDALVMGAPERFRRGRFHVLAFDYAHDERGPSERASDLYVPSAWAYDFAAAAGDRIRYEPVASIHPRRTGALAELEQTRQQTRYLKWVPQAQGIDPGSCEVAYRRFYQTMSDQNMVLLSHAGSEKALTTDFSELLGDPRRLLLPMAMGIRVIVAHSAGDYFLAFLSMLRDPRFEDRLVGEISALTQRNRLAVEDPSDNSDWTSHPIRDLLLEPELWPRLVNGSDYPLPAIGLLIALYELVDAGLIPAAELDPLAEIRDHNPLLFDFVVKRSLRVPYGRGREGFDAAVFQSNPILEGDRPTPLRELVHELCPAWVAALDESGFFETP